MIKTTLSILRKAWGLPVLVWGTLFWLVAAASFFPIESPGQVPVSEIVYLILSLLLSVFLFGYLYAFARNATFDKKPLWPRLKGSLIKAGFKIFELILLLSVIEFLILYPFFQIPQVLPLLMLAFLYAVYLPSLALMIQDKSVPAFSSLFQLFSFVRHHLGKCLDLVGILALMGLFIYYMNEALKLSLELAGVQNKLGFALAALFFENILRLYLAFVYVQFLGLVGTHTKEKA